MAKQIKPDEYIEFSGIVTAGHPLMRPKQSAASLVNFRVMPGNPNWIRLRGGRYLAFAGSASWGQFFQFNRAAAGGGVYHIGRRYTGSVHKWQNLVTSVLPYTVADIETISTSYGFDSSLLSPVASLGDNVFLDNGLGARGVGPPLSQWNGTRIRYAGLDAYLPSGTPAVAFTQSPTGTSKLKYGRTIYFGLYNSATNHYSNGIKIGKIEPLKIFATETTGAYAAGVVAVQSSAYFSVGDTVRIGTLAGSTATVTSVPSDKSVGLSVDPGAAGTVLYVVNGRMPYLVDDSKTPAGFYMKVSGSITASANSQTVTVDDSSRLRVGDQVYVGGMTPLTAAPELVTVLAVPSDTSFTAVFASNHSAGALVTLNDSKAVSDFGILDAPSRGNIALSGLNNLTHVYHDPSEQGELFYVFYSTLDGGEVPYLVLKSDGSGPLTLAVTGGGTITLDLNAVDGTGHIVDVTSEMPRENFPPRPLNQLTEANGRLYGSLRSGGAGAATASENAGNGSPFSYVVANKDLAAVVFSAAADDVQDRDFVGVPTESWPLRNKKFTLNGEVPIIVQAINELDDVLVITKNGTFILRETADMLHEWSTVSLVDGILDSHSFVQTIYGPMWVTQNRQVVLLVPGTTTLKPMSEDYAALLNGIVSASADYLRDPNHQIDRYQVWIGSGKSVCHDFYIEQRGGFAAWTTSGQSVSVAKTMISSSGNIHHIMAIAGNLYAQEAHPITGVVAIADQNTTPGTDDTEIDGTWISQWTDYGDAELRKHLESIDILGDSHPQEISPNVGVETLVVSWYADLDNEEFVVPDPRMMPQGDIDLAATQLVRFKVTNGKRRWYKFKLVLKGHSKEAGTLYYDFAGDGDLRPNYYGAIWRAMVTISPIGDNRP